MTSRVGSAVGCAALMAAISTGRSAGESNDRSTPVDGLDDQALSFEAQQSFLPGFDYDTGWLPQDSPAAIRAGYENRQLAYQDFNDDRKDAGEIGAGHSVTALYEVVPAGAGEVSGKLDALKYQSGSTPSAAAASGELMTVKIRYKQPDGDRSKLIARTIRDGGTALQATSDDFRFSAAVAAFGMSLRQSKQRGSASFAMARKLAKTAMNKARSDSETEARREFVELVEEAAGLAGATARRAG